MWLAENNYKTLFRKREERHQAINNEEGNRQNIGALGGSVATGGSGAYGGSGATEERPTMDVRRAVNTTGGGTILETKVEKRNENNSDKMFNVRTCPL